MPVDFDKTTIKKVLQDDQIFIKYPFLESIKTPHACLSLGSFLCGPACAVCWGS